MIKIITILMMISMYCHADTIILGDRSHILNFLAEVESNDQLNSYADAYIQWLQNEKNNSKVFDQYEFAEFQYHSGHTTQAIHTLDNLIQQYSSKILNPEASAIITKSFLLRASLSQTHHHKLYWVKKAFIYNPFFHFPDGVYSPQISKLWQHTLKNTKKVTIQVSKDFRDFQYLMINNKKFELFKESHITWPVGTVNYQFIGNHHAPYSGSSNLKQLAKIKPHSQPLVTGDCQNFSLSKKVIASIQPSIYFSDNCIVPDESQFKLNTAEVQHLTKPPLSNTHTALPLNTKTKPPGLLKNKWFWVVIGGLALYQNLNQHGKSSDQQSETTDIILPAFQ